jgi:flagellin-like protein
MTRPAPSVTDRGLAPVVGTLLLVGVVLATATTLAVASGNAVSVPVPGVGASHAATASDGLAVYRGAAGSGGPAEALASPSAAGRRAFSLSVTGDRVALGYERGPPMRVADLRLRVAVDGDPLAHQPPVPFFSARGFRPGPTGPFNVGSDGVWSAGETGSVDVAGTNRPRIGPGRTVTVRLYERGSSRPLVTLTASVT